MHALSVAMDNKVIAARLREAAERLEERGDAAFRSAAFLRAAAAEAGGAIEHA